MIVATLPSNAGLVLNIRMPLPVSLFIGLRYSQSRKGNAFISFITLFSVAGIFLGVMALTIVSSVMNGFEGELKKRILGVIPHLVVSAPAEYVEQWQAPLLRQPQVQQVTPFLQAEALVQSPRQLTGVLLQGVKTDALPDFMRQALLLGDWQQFASQRDALADLMIATTSKNISCGATACFFQCALPRVLQRKFVTLGLPSPPFYPIVPTWSAKNRPPELATDAKESVF